MPALRLCLLFGALAATSVLSTGAAAQALSYAVVDIGHLPGATTSIGTDLNDRLQVVGVSDGRPFVWDVDGGLRALPAPGTVDTVHINEHGLAAAVCRVGDRNELCAWWLDALVLRRPLPDGSLTLRELTNSGVALVTRWTNPVQALAYAGDAEYDLTTLFGGPVNSINETGLVGGELGGRGFLNDLDGRLRRPFPDGVPVGLVGNGGHFVGAPSGLFQQTLFLGAPDGQVSTIQTSGTFRQVTFHTMNRRGDFVATMYVFSTFHQSYLVRDRVARPLSDFVSSNVSGYPWARGISDSGHLSGAVGASVIVGGPQRAVLFVPGGPATPSNLSARQEGNLVVVRWHAVPGASAYRLEAGTSPGATDVHRGVVGSATELRATVPPGRYFLRVRAMNGDVFGEASTEAVVEVRP